MKVTYPPSIESTVDYGSLQKATELLEGTATVTSSGLPSIGDTSDVSAVWSIQERNGRKIYVLRIFHSGSEVTAEFYPSDLTDSRKANLLSSRLARLWGDLLEKRSHQQLEELLKPRQ